MWRYLTVLWCVRNNVVETKVGGISLTMLWMQVPFLLVCLLLMLILGGASSLAGQICAQPDLNWPAWSRCLAETISRSPHQNYSIVLRCDSFSCSIWKEVWSCTQTVFGEMLSAEALFQTVSSQLVGFPCPGRLKSLLSYEGKCLSCESTWNLAAVHESEEMLSINTWCVCLCLKSSVQQLVLELALVRWAFASPDQEGTAKAKGCYQHSLRRFFLAICYTSETCSCQCWKWVLLCFCGVVPSGVLLP